MEAFLRECAEIRRTGIALGTVLDDHAGQAAASVTLVGPATAVKPRAKAPRRLLVRHVDIWSQRTVSPREAV